MTVAARVATRVTVAARVATGVTVAARVATGVRVGARGATVAFMLIEQIPLWFTETNAYLVAPNGPGGDAVLIDAPPEPDPIVERLSHHNLRLVALINTHGHVDHVGGVAEVLRHAHDHLAGREHQHHGTAGDEIVHQALDDDGQASPEFTVEGAQASEVPVYIHPSDRHMLLDPVGASGAFGSYLGDLDVSPPELICDLTDGEVVRGGGMSFTALHTPGHTKGSTCLLMELEGQQVLFSGDHLFAGSIGRTDLPGGSFEELMESMESKILPLDDRTAVLPGHGPTTTVGRERATNPFLAEIRSRQTGPDTNPRWG